MLSRSFRQSTRSPSSARITVANAFSSRPAIIARRVRTRWLARSQGTSVSTFAVSYQKSSAPNSILHTPERDSRRRVSSNDGETSQRRSSRSHRARRHRTNAWSAPWCRREGIDGRDSRKFGRQRCLLLVTTNHRGVYLPMDYLFSCESCDHPATEHRDTGCGLCSCVNPLEAIVYTRSDVADSESREPSEAGDGLRSA